MDTRFYLLVIFGTITVFIHSTMGALHFVRGTYRGTEQFYDRKPLKLDTGKLIIDTDGGADDAAAIFITLSGEKSNSNLKVIAVTCVNGNTVLDNVVVNVLKTLKTVNRLDIPVYAGASKSILTTPPSDNYFGQDGFGDFEFPNPPDPEELLKKEHAVNALIRIVTENPGEVTLLCLGPLTNIALAIRMDPTFLTKVKQVAIMGGSIEGVGNVMPGIEFNFYVDPLAASIVFNATDTSTGEIKPIILLPFESVVRRNIIGLDWRKNVLGILPSPAVQLLNKAERVQLEADVKEWECSDCLSAATIVDPSLILQSAEFYAYVPTDGTLSQGAVFVDYWGKTGIFPNVFVVRSINVNQYKNMLLSGIGGS